MGQLERYSILGAGKILRVEKDRNPFPVLEEAIQYFYGQGGALPATRFTGGLVGFVSYEAARYLEKLPIHADDDLKLPTVAFFEATEFILFDHFHKNIWIVAENERRVAQLENFLCAEGEEEIHIRKSDILPHANFSQSDFMTIVERCKRYIASGDIYQANLSQRFEVRCDESAITLYKKLRHVNPSPFASFLDFGDFQLVSSSPERLVLCENGTAQTRPIAGTRKRGGDFREDEALAGDLLLNEKERAEHLMLVDLERNDLGRACRYGSVRVDELMVVEKYSHVMHIVSNVQGELHNRKTALDLFAAMFPGGTITGCPKIRSMEIIEELESLRRGPYTGSIGYFSANGNMDMSITIRTIVKLGDRAFVQVGAGIMADSDPEREYWETVQKAKAMLEVLEPQTVEVVSQR